MTDKARLSRIGELLSRAIARQVQREEFEFSKASMPSLPEDADPIILFLAQVGKASPSEIQSRFELSRSTTFRRLNKLVKHGKLKQDGSTNRRRYFLN